MLVDGNARIQALLGYSLGLRWTWILPTLCACGRFGFDVAVGDGGASDSNAALDALDASNMADCPPAIGSVCVGDGIYAGSFGGREYMVTAPGCDEATMPTCSGNDYNFQRDWGANVDIAQMTNIGNAADPSPAGERGDYNTPYIVAAEATGAAGFCFDLVWGGFDDWYLPSKSELAYIFCKSMVQSPSALYPEEDPNCAAVGGKTAELTGWSTAVTRIYWSSTEEDLQFAWALDFRDGSQATYIKNNPFAVRCVRSY